MRRSHDPAVEIPLYLGVAPLPGLAHGAWGANRSSNGTHGDVVRAGDRRAGVHGGGVRRYVVWTRHRARQLAHLRQHRRWSRTPALVHAQRNSREGTDSGFDDDLSEYWRQLQCSAHHHRDTGGDRHAEFRLVHQRSTGLRLPDGSGRASTIPLSRLTQNVTCSDTSARPTNADFWRSGVYYNVATSGQGLTVEVNPISRVLFLAWMTYAPNGAGAGPAGQRWYTGLGGFAAGSSSIPVDLYETTGGSFDDGMTSPRTVVVGSGTLTFEGCSA